MQYSTVISIHRAQLVFTMGQNKKTLTYSTHKHTQQFSGKLSALKSLPFVSLSRSYSEGRIQCKTKRIGKTVSYSIFTYKCADTYAQKKYTPQWERTEWGRGNHSHHTGSTLCFPGVCLCLYVSTWFMRLFWESLQGDGCVHACTDESPQWNTEPNTTAALVTMY